MIIGSGPIVIGQGCEFDYSGTQACKALREEGYRIVLVNSNPATIMTDPQFADRTYIEPITPAAVAKIIEQEHPDALLPTLGGQTGLNTAAAVADMGVLGRFGVEMIGATREVIHRAEDRTEFKQVCLGIGLDVPRSGIARTMEQARQVVEEVGLPCCIRPAYTLGGTGGGFAFNREEFEVIAARGLEYSPISEVLIEESVLGWKEYELEVMRDKADNVVIVCSIENFDPMGVHTGDSITVAPAQTLTDKEYQLMRDAAIAIIRAIGVETGGSNIQFAVEPETGRMIVVEMNPRVSRSSALASKATGFPIAKIAAKLAVGYTLDEIPNDITRQTPACFEPTIDYCVVKIPRWTFEKFPDADETLTTQMKSVGEAMSIGRTFKEALQKGIRSMEVKRYGLGLDTNDKWLNARKVRGERVEVRRQNGRHEEAGPHLAPLSSHLDLEWPVEEPKLTRKLSIPCQGRLYYTRYAFKLGWSLERVHELTRIDRWFLAQIQQLVEFEDELQACGGLDAVPSELLRRAKQWAYSDIQLATIWNTTPEAVRARRGQEAVQPVYKLVDTCAAEFEAYTPYYYSTYETPLTTVARSQESGAGGEEPGTGNQEPGAGNGARPGAANPQYYSAKQGFAAKHESAIRNPQSASPQSAIRNPQSDDEVRVTDKKKIIILGGGPNRIGQGIEFDYCCVHAAFAARELGYEAVMVNSNPETVSTDYDTSDMLFFEPLTLEDVLNICERLNGGPLRTAVASSPEPAAGNREPGTGDQEPGAGNGARSGAANPQYSSAKQGFAAKHESAIRNPQSSGSAIRNPQLQPEGLLHGVIVQFGGQTPLNLARGLEAAGVPIIGTSPESIDLAEDRRRFGEVLEELKLRCPPGGTAFSVEQARKVADRVGYPVLVRPSYVLGGRAMEIVSDARQLDTYMARAVDASTVGRDHPILIDKFLDHATEVDVDCVADFGPPRASSSGPSRASSSGPSPDGRPEPNPRAVICGVIEHIEHAGVHSGDAACVLPPFSLSEKVVGEIERQTRLLARRLAVRGLMNVQFAVRDGEVFVLEVNPRASRTVPFVSKATGVPWAKLAAKVMAGMSLEELGVAEPPRPPQTSVKESVFPFTKFPGVDVILGPEMRSTGEVMGIDMSFGVAFAKSQIAAGLPLPTSGTVFLSVCDADKPRIVAVAQHLAAMGFKLLATSGTHRLLRGAGVRVQPLPKLSEGRPNIADYITNGEVNLLINTPTHRGPTTDEGRIRAMATLHNVSIITTMTAAQAAVAGIAALRAAAEDPDRAADAFSVRPLQEYFPQYGEA
jgi:carbamoylphosphate synthase large subunit